MFINSLFIKVVHLSPYSLSFHELVIMQSQIADAQNIHVFDETAYVTLTLCDNLDEIQTILHVSHRPVKIMDSVSMGKACGSYIQMIHLKGVLWDSNGHAPHHHVSLIFKIRFWGIMT